MCGDKKAFFELDESFCDIIKFGDKSMIFAMGKGKVTIQPSKNLTHISLTYFLR